MWDLYGALVSTIISISNSTIGKIVDSASASGTVLARLKYIIDTSVATVQSTLNTILNQLVSSKTDAKIGTAKGTSSGYTTAHSYSGSGVLHFIGQGIYIDNAVTALAQDGSVKLTIDGTVVYDGIASTIQSMGTAAFYSNNANLNIVSMPIPFASTLLIEHKSGGSETTVLTGWNYTI